jgi:hypothetical protein
VVCACIALSLSGLVACACIAFSGQVVCAYAVAWRSNVLWSEVACVIYMVDLVQEVHFWLLVYSLLPDPQTDLNGPVHILNNIRRD